MKRRTLTIASVIVIARFATTAGYASEIGHFAPGVANIRDFVVPDPGLYGAIYNYGYMSNRINDANGNTVESMSLDADLNVYALAPTVLWGSKVRVLGGRYGAYFTQSLSNTSVNGTLSNLTISAKQPSDTGTQFGIGDTFVQPLWLGWSGKRYDISYGYSFYIPSGRYHTEMMTTPVGPVRVESPDNVGFGFWTNQNQGAVYLYPWADKRMAIQNMLTWEIHGKKRGFDLIPGQNLSWNWGVSQYLQLKKDNSLLLEVGPAGYSSWQVSDDTGSAALNPSVHDYVHAVGIQVAVASVKRNVLLSFHYMNEFSSVDRFQGQCLGLNVILQLRGGSTK